MRVCFREPAVGCLLAHPVLSYVCVTQICVCVFLCLSSRCDSPPPPQPQPQQPASSAASIPRHAVAPLATHMRPFDACPFPCGWWFALALSVTLVIRLIMGDRWWLGRVLLIGLVLMWLSVTVKSHTRPHSRVGSYYSLSFISRSLFRFQG